jgi:glycosyltransferase involved in cell wall biosynthesis
MTTNHQSKSERFVADSRPESAMPKVSFCMPCYNGVVYLRSAVDSVLAQSVENFELIVVDDASTDGTFELARELAAQDDRIRVYRNAQNLGIAPNWNRCIELARGEWIKFIFQDDMLAPECTAQLLDATRRTKQRLVFCEREPLIEADNIDLEHRQTFEQGLRFSEVLPGLNTVTANKIAGVFLDHLRENFLGEPTCFLIHRSSFFQYGMFNPQLIAWCDFEYWVRVACHEGVAYVPDKLVTFRVHAAGATATYRRCLRKRFRNEALDLIIMYTSFLLDPLFHPLRTALPGATNRLLNAFDEAVALAERYLRNVKDPADLTSIRSQWQATLALNPAVELLERRTSLRKVLLSKFRGLLATLEL